MTTLEASVKWGLSDRRVRVLCENGRIPGAVKDGKSYKIPSDAQKPSDKRFKNSVITDDIRYLKWDNTVIGIIKKNNAVTFINPAFNEIVMLYTRGQIKWTPDEFIEFLTERTLSRDRRDIERILFRMGLSQYDVLRIAEITRGMHPKDLLWIAHSKNERIDTAMTDVFSSIFHQRIDMAGDSVDTPEGHNIKRYGVYNGRYGIYKKRISPLLTDVESEVAVSLLANELGIAVCPAIRIDDDTVFSTFLYDFSKEYIVHFRRLFDGARSSDEYNNLINVRPQFTDDIARMILLDFITRQDDRHLSNMAIKISNGIESFYALYDNGRSLFYEDTEETVHRAVADPAGYATSFGYAGTYWDYVCEIARKRKRLSDLINLNISKSTVRAILSEAQFTGYRFDGALEWILKTLELVKSL